VNNRGFTLIELSVVVLLIGMMLLIAVPRIRDTLLNDELRAAARRVIGTAGELRDESVRQQTDYILHIDLGNQAFWSYTADATAEKRAELRKGAFRFPEGIRITGIRRAYEGGTTEGEVVIRFSRKGYVEPAVIHLAKDERAVTLVLNPFTPAVTVYEKYVDFSFNEQERAAGI